MISIIFALVLVGNVHNQNDSPIKDAHIIIWTLDDINFVDNPRQRLYITQTDENGNYRKTGMFPRVSHIEIWVWKPWGNFLDFTWFRHNWRNQIRDLRVDFEIYQEERIGPTKRII